jgi:ATP synthase protein I
VYRNVRPAAARGRDTGIRAGDRACADEAGGLRHAGACSHTAAAPFQTRHNRRAGTTRAPRFRTDAALRSGHTGTTEKDPREIAMPPQKSMADTMRVLGALSTVGISIVLAIVIGAACGYYLDRWLGTGPWLFLLFVLFGIAAGITNVYRTAGRFFK